MYDTLCSISDTTQKRLFLSGRKQNCLNGASRDIGGQLDLGKQPQVGSYLTDGAKDKKIVLTYNFTTYFHPKEFFLLTILFCTSKAQAFRFSLPHLGMVSVLNKNCSSGRQCSLSLSWWGWRLPYQSCFTLLGLTWFISCSDPCSRPVSQDGITAYRV